MKEEGGNEKDALVTLKSRRNWSELHDSGKLENLFQVQPPI